MLDRRPSTTSGVTRVAARAAARCSSATRCPTRGRARACRARRDRRAAVPRARQRLPAGADQPGEPAHDQLDVRRVPRRRTRCSRMHPRRRGRARARRRRRDPGLQRPGRADHARSPSTTTSCRGVVSMPKGLWRRALPGGLTANALRPRHAVRPRRRARASTTPGSTSRLSNLGAWPPGTGSRKPRTAPSSW